MNLDGKQLGLVERWTLILAAILIAASVVAMPRRMALGVSLGAALMCVNAWALRRIGQRVFKTFAKPGFAILLFNLKMGVVLALVYLVLHYLPVDGIGFLVGVSVFPLAVVIAAVQAGMLETANDEVATPPTGDL